VIIRTPLFWIFFRVTRRLSSPTNSTKYIKIGCAADLLPASPEFYWIDFSRRSLLPCLSRATFISLLLALFLCRSFFSHKNARGSRWQASAANISECDLALIPLLYPLDLNNGDRANSPSVTVNLQAHSTEFNRAAGNLLRKSGKNVPLEDSLSFYLNAIYTRNEKGHLPVCR